MIEILIGKTGFLTMFHLIMSQNLKPDKLKLVCQYQVKLKLVCVAVGAGNRIKILIGAEKRFEIFMGKTRRLTMFQLKIHALFFNIMVHVL